MKPMNRIWAVLLTLGMITPLMAQEAGDTIQAGVHYTVINPAQPTNDASKIEVVEVFSYMCPHCHSFQPFMDKWAEELSDDIEFRRQPVVFGRPQWVPTAKAYYIIEAMDAIDGNHNAIFEGIHRQGKRFTSDEDVADYLATKGLSKDDYMKTAGSFGIETKLKRGITLTRKYGVRGTPSVVINGKYLTTATMAGSMEKAIEVIEHLVEKERAELAANASTEPAEIAES